MAPTTRPKPAPVHGLRHIVAAAGYSLGGLRRLMQETAFRLELAACGAGILLFALLGAEIWEYALLSCLFLLLIAVEALNTAVECLVDHLAPDWQEFARDAKDLGSLSVLCVLLICGGFIGVTALRHFCGL
nr:diacylglycerol kinase [Amylibacter sp.]